MLLCLEVRRIASASSEAGAEERYHFRFSREEVLIGRSDAVDVQLPDAAISLVHARLVVDKGRWLLMDMGSTNGTSLDGERLTAGEARTLYPGALLRLGPFAVEVQATCDEAMAPAGEGPQTAELARQMVRDVLGALDQSDPFFEVLSGPTKGARVAVPVAGGLIGRGADCAVSLPDKDASRHHARVQRAGGTVQIEDLESKNGVFVDEQQVASLRALEHGQLVRVGSTKLRFIDPAQKLLGELQAPREDEVTPTSADPLLESEVTEPSDGDQSIDASVEGSHPALAPSPAELAAHQVEPDTSSSPLEKVLLFGVGGLLIVGAVVAAFYLIL